MRYGLAISFAMLAFTSCKEVAEKKYTNWESYGGSNERIRYSDLTQIDTNTIASLEPIWTYSSGDADTANHSQIQCNPIIIGDRLFGVSAQMKLFCIDATTGKQLWIFDPNIKSKDDPNAASSHIMINSRGVAYWSDGGANKRLFFTAGSFTYAINADSGTVITSFGKAGKIDLHEGLDRNVSDLFVVNTSPGTIYKNLLILGTRVDEGLPSAPGHIRAYDVVTGERKWIFHTIPQPGEPGYETWSDSNSYKITGGANAWSGFSLDEANGILFVPTGSAAYDFYGGNRKGANLYSNCLIALDAASGKKIWHQQLVHHDLWDKDLPTPPALVTLQKNGSAIEAVAQPTKQGLLFIFERKTGKPVYDIIETPVDTTGALPGEAVWSTQPIPVKPEPFSRQTITEKDINPYLADSSKEKVLQQFHAVRTGKIFMPPGKQPSLVFPGFDGGAEWGGPAFDPKTGLLYVNTNEMPWVMEMLENKPEKLKVETNLVAGKRLFIQYCSTCHGADRKGSGNNPSLLAVDKKYDTASFYSLLGSGRRMMPAFGAISSADKEAIASYVLNQTTLQKKQHIPTEVQTPQLPYRMKSYSKFLSPEGFPAISPPWGTLTAIDLNEGRIKWKIPLGEYKEFMKPGIPITGTENYGGPVVTAGGLVFIAATKDSKIRAFNKYSGKQVWEYKLPAPGFATPAIYEIKGKQYLVIACGGGKLGTNSSDQYIAFGLK